MLYTGHSWWGESCPSAARANWAMAIKEYSTFPKAPTLRDPDH